jgi:RNA-binding protein YlmH
LLSGVHPETLEACARVVERAQAASDQWRVEVTDFLDPATAEAASTCVGRMADCEARAWGGHERAERVRLLLGRPESLDAPGDERSFAALTSGDANGSGVVALLRVAGNFLFDPAEHRDFLGAALGTGIDRGKLGDVLVQGERGAQILCAPEMATFLTTAMTSVRSVPVTCSVESLDALSVPPAEDGRLPDGGGVHAPGRGRERGVQDEPEQDERSDRAGAGQGELEGGV